MGTLVGSSFETGGAPQRVAVNETAGLVYVTAWDNTVVIFNDETGAYLGGSLGAASFITGNFVRAVAVHPGENILYAGSLGGQDVVRYNATTGAYVDTDLATSSTAVGGSCFGAAVNTAEDILYVTATSVDAIVYLDALTGGYLFGTLEASSFTTGGLPYAIAVSD